MPNRYRRSPLNLSLKQGSSGMSNFNEENERIKRRYFQYLRTAKRLNAATVEKAAQAIRRFEASTGYKRFKKFHIEQAVAFQIKLERAKTAKGNPLAKSTLSSILAANKDFVFWLAGQPGYKSRIRHSDADYFNQSFKDSRVARAVRDTPYPTLGQVARAFELMPQTNDIEWRNKALIAFLMLTGARDGAIAFLRLKRIDLIEGCAYQDARDVKTKSSKTFTTWFLPVDPVYLDCFEGWVQHLQNDLHFGHDDPLFPKPLMGRRDGLFAVTGLSRDGYSNANMIRSVVKLTFENAGFQPFTPHSFRKTLVRWADKHYPSREGFKAFSQNIGHSDVVTTVNAYCPVSSERQAELIRG
jgi:integrase/recombinase XerD